MQNQSVRFRCPKCNARIKAPAELIGQRRTCPGCSESFIVPSDLPEDAGPVLVLQEGEDRFALHLRYQRSA